MSDHDRLREAARVLRERAEAATPGPWASPPEGRRVHGPREADDLGRGPSAILAAEMPWRPGRMQANADYVATMHPGVALALADWLDAEAAGDGYLPHRYPEDAPEEVIAWKCQACGDVIREMYGPATTCTVDWRPRNPLAVAVADQILGTP